MQLVLKRPLFEEFFLSNPLFLQGLDLIKQCLTKVVNFMNVWPQYVVFAYKKF